MAGVIDRHIEHDPEPMVLCCCCGCDGQTSRSGSLLTEVSMTVNERIVAQRNKARHDELCKFVGDEVRRFMQIGPALIELQKLQVYKETFKTFEEFVNKTFGIEKRRAYQIIEAAKVNDNLCKILHKTEVPTNDSQLREVAKAPEEKQVEVVQIANEVAKSEDRKPTASDYRNAVEIVVGSDPKPAPKPPDPEPSELTPESVSPQIIAIASRIDGMLRELKVIAQDVGGEWLPMDSIEAEAKQLKTSIRFAAFWAHCPPCGGTGAKGKCSTCKGFGWLSRSRKSLVPADVLAAIEE